MFLKGRKSMAHKTMASHASEPPETEASEGRVEKLRGYLLLEVALGGMLVALIIAPLLSVLGQARVEAIIGQRRAIAQSLAIEGIERATAVDLSLLTPANFPANQTITPQEGSYTRQFTLTPGTASLNGSSVNFVRISTRVFFTVEGVTYETSLTNVRYVTSG